jgi:glycosyltransferase involved in cell wall biosynthesis
MLMTKKQTLAPGHDCPVNLQIVVPCLDEEAVLPEAARRFDVLLERLIESGKISTESRVTFVDDGSRDCTWALIEQEARASSRVAGIRLSRNRGHQNAVLAGLQFVGGDAVVSIDADLQDDPDAIERMVDEFRDGCDIVYGVRADRSSDSLFKRGTALLFYRLLAPFGVELVHNHADFRLMSRRAIEALRAYREVNLYLRGIIPLIGFRQTSIEYVRKPRFAGESKYTLRKMWALALEAVTSFSTLPLQIIFVLGFTVFLGSVATSAWVLWVTIFTQRAVPGWASTVLPMLFLGGIQILCLGVIGAYLGKVYSEVKARPRYFIDRTVGQIEPAVSAAPNAARKSARALIHESRLRGGRALQTSASDPARTR